MDSRTVRLNLAIPVLSVAEDCGEFCTLIVHPSFKPPLSQNPIGTGPYTVAELRVSDRCILKRVTKTTNGREFRYWGGDVYLDEIHFYNYEQDNQTTALASGSVDAVYELTIEQLELARTIPGAQILTVDSAQTLCCRMQVDAKPFDDIRVRRAIVKAADNVAITKLVFGTHAQPANNFHVAPVHPEFYPLPPAVRDLAGARQLLKEAGHESGLELTIYVGNNDGPWHQAVCEALRDQLREGRHQSERQRAAADQILGGLEKGAVRGDVLGAPSARHHGARAGIPHGRVLERVPLVEPRVRCGTLRRGGHAGRQGAQDQDAEGGDPAA